MTFEDWLADHELTRGPVGDLARDVAADPDWPADAGRHEQLAYLQSVGACHGALDALNLARRLWRRTLRGHRMNRRVRLRGSLFRPLVPAGAVDVTRRSGRLDRNGWGNPWPVGKPSPVDGAIAATAVEAVARFRQYLTAHPDVVARVRRDLAGYDLACWCPPDQPCHADVLLEVAKP